MTLYSLEIPLVIVKLRLERREPSSKPGTLISRNRGQIAAPMLNASTAIISQRSWSHKEDGGKRQKVTVMATVALTVPVPNKC